MGWFEDQEDREERQAAERLKRLQEAERGCGTCRLGTLREVSHNHGEVVLTYNCSAPLPIWLEQHLTILTRGPVNGLSGRDCPCRKI